MVTNRRAQLTPERARSAAAVLARHAEADHEALAMLARAKLAELLEETGGIYTGDPRTVADRMRSALAAALDRAIISPLELPSLTWQGPASVDPRVVSRRRTVPGDLPDEVGCRFHSTPELNCYRCFTADRETTG